MQTSSHEELTIDPKKRDALLANINGDLHFYFPAEIKLNYIQGLDPYMYFK
jgi:hypothetical protein